MNPGYWALAVIAGTACGLSFLLTPMVRRLAKWTGLVAAGSQDRWHREPTPLLGGVAIWAALSGGLWVLSRWGWEAPWLLGLWICVTLMAAMGCVDDYTKMSPSSKLFGQICCTSLLLAFGINVQVTPWAFLNVPLAFFWVIGITNALNLLDNMDGLAAGVAAIASFFLACYAAGAGHWALAAAAIALTGAALGFLRYNFQPARIFMGDCGSMLLGFLLAALAMIGSSQFASNLVATLAVPFLLLAVPIFDTSLVTLARQFHGRPVTEGGRDHISHRLVLMGLSERRAVLFLYLMTALFGVLAVTFSQIYVLTASLFVLLALAVLLVFGMFLGRLPLYQSVSEESLTRQPEQPAVLKTLFVHKRRFAEVLADLAVLFAAYYAAYYLRYEGDLATDVQAQWQQTAPWIIVIKLGSFFAFGMYRGLWRYVGVSDLVTIFRAVTFSSLVGVLWVTFSYRFEYFSRVVFVIDWLLTFVLVSGVRVMERMLVEYFNSLAPAGKRAVIMGAGDAGAFLLRELRNNPRMGYRAVGFLDDDLTKVGRRIGGIPVLGTRLMIADLVAQEKADEVLIALPSASSRVIQEIVAVCREHGLPCRQMGTLLGAPEVEV